MHVIAAIPGPVRVLPLVAVLGVALGWPALTSHEASIWPAGGASSWPEEGARVEYDLESFFATPDGSYELATTARLVLVFDGGAWSGSCAGQATEVLHGVATTSEWAAASAGRPATGPTDARTGETTIVSLLDDPGVAEGCRHRAETVEVVGREGATFLGAEPSDTGAYQDVSVSWDAETGLVREWTRMVHGGSSSGRLVSTDAPRGG